MAPSPQSMRQTAAQLLVIATELEHVLDPVIARTGPHVWAGRAADAFEADLHRRRRGLRAVAAELDAEARRLMARADAVEAALESVPAPSP